MYSDELIRHPDLQSLIKKYKKAFPNESLECEMFSLGWFGYTGISLNVEAVKEILQKCLEENKYFKVWSICWEGKVAYYNYKN